jgi:hypothetical protein
VAGLSQKFNPGSLSALGIKSMKKLNTTSQLRNGPQANRCQTFGKRMDWKAPGLIIMGRKRSKEFLLIYSSHHSCSGDCTKRAYSEKVGKKGCRSTIQVTTILRCLIYITSFGTIANIIERGKTSPNQGRNCRVFRPCSQGGENDGI